MIKSDKNEIINKIINEIPEIKDVIFNNLVSTIKKDPTRSLIHEYKLKQHFLNSVKDDYKKELGFKIFWDCNTAIMYEKF
jgi:hypothetical protein